MLIERKKSDIFENFSINLIFAMFLSNDKKAPIAAKTSWRAALWPPLL
jgi:hypothetical protein